MSERIPPRQYETEKPESRLSPELQLKVRTPEFKEWFGDWENDPDNASKIVDENGEPLLVYSGLPAGIRELRGDRRFNTGDDEVGFYFTKRFSNARGMAQQRRDFETDQVISSSVYSAFLNIRHPYVVQRGDGVNTTRILQGQIPEGVDGFINSKLQEIVALDPDQVDFVEVTPVNVST
jgi:hypothetical protein